MGQEFTKEDTDKLGQIQKELTEINDMLTKGKARKLQMLGYAKRQAQKTKKGGPGSGQKSHSKYRSNKRRGSMAAERAAEYAREYADAVVNGQTSMHN